jgi:hypothetical protein
MDAIEDRVGPVRSGRRSLAATTVAFALIAAALMEGTATAGEGVRVVDPGTTCHRLYVIGAGNQMARFHQEDSAKAEVDDLKGALEQQGVTEAPGSTTRTLVKPTEQQLATTILTLHLLAQPGQEVTISFIGHGAGGPFGSKDKTGEPHEDRDEHFRLNDGNGNGKYDAKEEQLTDDEFQAMINNNPGFQDSVTLLVIANFCFGGGFTGGGDDLTETDHVTVLGHTGTCPLDPVGENDPDVQTLFEDIVNGAGQKAADTNQDGSVTAAELETWLLKLPDQFPRIPNWRFGPPNDSKKADVKSGKSWCEPFGDGDCQLPDLRIRDLSPGEKQAVPISGRGFGTGERVRIGFFAQGFDILERDRTNRKGRFRERLEVSDLPQGDVLLFAIDAERNVDWELIQVQSP